jgi:hypothetical protein
MAIHPVAVKNTFGSHLILWCLFLPLLTLIFIPMLFPEQSVNQSEVEMVAGFNVDVDGLTQAANSRFSKMFVESGAVARTEGFFSGANEKSYQAFAADWIHGVWLLIYKAVWRFYVLGKIFFLPLFVFGVAAAIDGFGVRARKKYTFETTNPVFFYSSTHMVVLIIGLFSFLPLAPITLSATLLIGLLMSFGVGVWLSASNFQTGS